MDEDFANHLEKAISIYTSEKYGEKLIKARKIFEGLTGKVDEEETSYEGRMLAFQDWYLFHFRDPDFKDKTLFENYLLEIGQNIKFQLYYSFFEVVKETMRKHIVLKELVYKDKISFQGTLKNLGLVKGDLFVGRVLDMEGKNYLLRGKSFTAPEMKKQLLLNFKIMLKKHKNFSLQDFTPIFLQIEKLNNRWQTCHNFDTERFFTLAQKKI